MTRAILAMLAVAVPALALAQTAPPDTGAQGPTPNPANLANPRAQSNMSQQSPHAQTSPGSGNATSIPTPVLGQKNTPTPQR